MKITKRSLLKVAILAWCIFTVLALSVNEHCMRQKIEALAYEVTDYIGTTTSENGRPCMGHPIIQILALVSGLTLILSVVLSLATIVAYVKSMKEPSKLANQLVNRTWRNGAACKQGCEELNGQ